VNPRVIEVLGWHSEIPGWDLPDPGEVSWQDQSLCAQTDPELFFLDKGGSSTPAKKVCAACPVRTECLEYALEHREPFGIFGGKTERQRRAILADREREAGTVRCDSRRHVLAGENVLPNGKCAACREAAFKSGEGRRLAKELAA
jgi:WhiB family transcriptional regulator, redox-sensing transcriptional regulator